MNNERLYSVLLAPIVSEKSTMLAEKNNQVAFRVLPSATKQEVKAAVEKLFKEKPPRKELAMRRKIDDYSNLISPEIGTASEQATIVKGVVSGVQLETVLRELARVEGYHDFDKLPIPFRAVATDLVTGKEVVFDEGELANVMRASMSVPGAVAPAEYRGSYWLTTVDGTLRGQSVRADCRFYPGSNRAELTVRGGGGGSGASAAVAERACLGEAQRRGLRVVDWDKARPVQGGYVMQLRLRQGNQNVRAAECRYRNSNGQVDLRY